MLARFLKIFILLLTCQISYGSRPMNIEDEEKESSHFVTLKAASGGFAAAHLSLDLLEGLGVDLSNVLPNKYDRSFGDVLHWTCLAASIHAGLYTLGYTCLYPNNDPHWYVQKFLQSLIIHGLADYCYYNSEELSDQDHRDFKAVLILSSLMTLYYGMQLNRAHLEKLFKFKKA